jgi:hypothetical protein
MELAAAITSVFDVSARAWGKVRGWRWTSSVWATLCRCATKVANGIDVLIAFVNFVTLAPSMADFDTKVPPTFGKVKLKRPAG